MIPTLMGRWQTRLVLLATIGVLVTALFAVAYDSRVFFLVLGYVLAFGIAWDVIYILLQRLRWDRDWPAAFLVAGGVVEGIVLYALIEYVGLPGIERGSVPLRLFAAHYTVTFLLVFLCTQGPMRVLFPRWRFSGGRVF